MLIRNEQLDLFAREDRTWPPQGILVRLLGHDEIADIILLEKDCVVLFSVKAGLLTEADAKGARSRTKIIDWFYRFLLNQRTSQFGEGAFVQLDRTVTQIRAGAFSSVARHLRIYPIVVTYEHLSENPMLYRWLAEGFRTRGLLQQADVGSAAVISAGTFETLVSVAARGASVQDLLDRRGALDGGEISLDTILRETIPEEFKRRLPQLELAFDTIVRRIKQKLFGTDPGAT